MLLTPCTLLQIHIMNNCVVPGLMLLNGTCPVIYQEVLTIADIPPLLQRSLWGDICDAHFQNCRHTVEGQRTGHELTQLVTSYLLAQGKTTLCSLLPPNSPFTLLARYHDRRLG